MSAKFIYSPYWYIIRDVVTGIYYVGSKFGKDACVDLFWVKDGYTTSSNLINSLVETDGLERFEVVKKEVRKDAYEYESRFLKRVNAAKNKNFYNGHNNNGFETRPDTIVVKDKDGKCFRIHKDHPEYINGNLVGVAKNITYKHKDNSNYKKKKANKENYKGLVTIFCEKDKKWIKIEPEHYNKNIHITPTSKPKSEEHKKKIGSSNRKPRPKVCCIKCKTVIGIQNITQHQNGSKCK